MPGHWIKSELHPVCSTAACSFHSYSMNTLSRFFILLCLIAVDLISVSTVPAQNLPNTTRLLRFPTTNGSQIVFCYAGELYTVAKDGGTARRLTSGPGYTSFARFSPDGTQIAFTSEYDGNREIYVMPAEGGTPKRLTTSATLGRDENLRIQIRGDVGWLTCTNDFTITLGGGEPLPGSGKFRSSEIYVREDESGKPVWKMWHCHYSPCAPDDKPRMGFGV